MPFTEKLKSSLQINTIIGLGAAKRQKRIYLESGIEKSKVFLAYYGGCLPERRTLTVNRLESLGRIRHSGEIPIMATVSYFYKPKWYMLQKEV